MIETRAFISERDENIYELVLRSDRDLEGGVYIRAVCDGGQEIDLQIQDAQDSQGHRIQTQHNKLTGVKLKKEEPFKLSLRCAKPGKYLIGAFSS